MKVAVPIAKNNLAPLGITAAASLADTGIQKKIHGSGTATLIISNEEMKDIMKIVQALEDSNILLKGVTKTIKNETKEQKGGFLSMLLGTLGSSLFGNLLHPLINFEIKEYYENEPRFGNLSPVEYSTENIQHIQNKVNVHHFQ